MNVDPGVFFWVQGDDGDLAADFEPNLLQNKFFGMWKDQNLHHEMRKAVSRIDDRLKGRPCGITAMEYMQGLNQPYDGEKLPLPAPMKEGVQHGLVMPD